MKKSYEKLISDSNIEMFSRMQRDNIDIFSLNKVLIENNKYATLQINFVNSATKITKDIKWHVRKNTHIKLQHNGLNSNYCCMAEKIANNASVPGLINALTIFIK